MTLALIIVSIYFALNWPQPQSVVLYLCIQLYANLLIFATNWLFHDTSLVYAVVYSVASLALMLTEARIVWEAVRGHQNSWKAVGIVGLISCVLGRMGVAALGHPASYQDLIGIVEGSFLFGAGLSIGALAPYLERWDLALVLGFLWLAQAFFRLGFIIHLDDWLALNWQVPPALCICGFLLLGLLARRRTVVECSLDG